MSNEQENFFIDDNVPMEPGKRQLELKDNFFVLTVSDDWKHNGEDTVTAMGGTAHLLSPALAAMMYQDDQIKNLVLQAVILYLNEIA